LLAGSVPSIALAQDACPADEPPASNATLADALAAAETVAPQLDAATLNARMGPVRTAVACLSEEITPENALRYHVLRALQADPLGINADREEVQAPAHRAWQLTSAMAAEPPELGLALPEGHGLKAAFAGGTAPEQTAARRPRTGAIAFDGATTTARPANAATVFQLLDDDERALRTAFLHPSEQLPEYPARHAVARPALGIGSGLCLAWGGIAWGLALGAEHRYLDSASDRFAEPSTLRANRALAAGAGAGAGLGLALGVAAVAVGPR
jgi:hypothetical protein